MQRKPIMRSEMKESVGERDMVEFTGHFSAKCRFSAVS